MSATLLAITMFIYLLVAWSEYQSDHLGLSIAFSGYAFSNIGLIIASWR